MDPVDVRRAPLTARVTVLAAVAGYGKTEAVRRWLGGAPARWYDGALPADADPDPGWIVVDDVAEDQLRGQIDRVPAGARAVLIARWPGVTPGRTARPGLVAELGAADLALSPGETAGLLQREYGRTEPALAAAVHEGTAGWPALVRLAGERLATADSTDVAGLAGPGSAIATYLDKYVLAGMPVPAARLVRDLAHLGAPRLGVVDEDLCRALGHRRPDRTIALLARVGIVVGGGRSSVRRLVPFLAEVVRDRWPLTGPERERLLGAAGEWYAANGRPGDAIATFGHCGRWAEAAELLRRYGAGWVIAGGAPTIAATIGAMPAGQHDAGLRLLHGEALLVLGEDDRALTELTALADEAAAAGSGDLPAALAWRLGAVHYLRADPHSAAAAFARGRFGDPGAGADEALLLAWDATARWMIGDGPACGELAVRALAAADRAGDDRGRAAAHVALAMRAMLAGDHPGNAAHLDHALRCAEAARDIVQAARIHGNRAARLLEEAQYGPALAESRRAKELAEATGYSAILAVACCNEGDALFRLGRLDEAADSYQRALAVFQHKGSHKVAYPLVGLGAIHRARGRHNLARAAYEEATRAASATGDMQGMVPARAGLARVLAGTDPAAAAREAALARAAASGPFVAAALLATGWAQLGAGELAAAATTALEAAAQARRHRDPGGLAEALELRAAALPTGQAVAEARTALLEAAATWRLTGAPLDLDRVTVALGALPGAAIADRIAARLARERLAAAGVALPLSDRPGSGPGVAGQPPQVAIRSLGRFTVLVEGAAVTMSMWQSRKARDLLRVLVARRGRATARDELTELLWPGEDSERLAHRLSVALSTVRSVLDPDRRADPDHFVHADRSGVALETGHLAIDLELFLAEAAHGLALSERGCANEALAALAAAERRYTGDFLEHEPYEDWSVAAREEARATYLRTVRTVAALSRQVERVDDAVQYLLKVIDKDPYDEAAHRELVATLAAAGRHGESRRAQARYRAAMAELGLEPSR